MYVIAPAPYGGHQLLHIDGPRAQAVAYVTDETFGLRLIDLLHRHGLEDVPLELPNTIPPIPHLTDPEGTT